MCTHCNSWLLQSGVVRFWQLRVVLLPFFITHYVILTVTQVCGVVKDSLSDDVVVLLALTPCSACGEADTTAQKRESRVWPERFIKVLWGFFIRVLLVLHHITDQGALACSVFLLEETMIRYTSLWSHSSTATVYLKKKPPHHQENRMETKIQP